MSADDDMRDKHGKPPRVTAPAGPRDAGTGGRDWSAPVPAGQMGVCSSCGHSSSEWCAPTCPADEPFWPPWLDDPYRNSRPTAPAGPRDAGTIRAASNTSPHAAVASSAGTNAPAAPVAPEPAENTMSWRYTSGPIVPLLAPVAEPAETGEHEPPHPLDDDPPYHYSPAPAAPVAPEPAELQRRTLAAMDDPAVAERVAADLGLSAPAPVAEPAETREALREVFTDLIALCDATTSETPRPQTAHVRILAHRGLDRLAALPAPAVPGDAERRPPYTGSAADSWVVGYQDGREDEAKAWRRGATLAADGDLLIDAAEVASLRRSLADAEDRWVETYRLLQRSVDVVAAERDSLRRSLADAEAKVAAVTALTRDEGQAMHLWWTASGDDWAVPNWLPGKFLATVLADAALAAPGTDDEGTAG